MATTDLRIIVKEYVKNADVRLLKLMKAGAESYQKDEQEITLTENQYQLIDKRREPPTARICSTLDSTDLQSVPIK